MKAPITKEQRCFQGSAGFAIVAVLVIIIIITVMVTVFLTSSRFDFTSSNAFSRNVHAEQLAVSGGEEVVSLLSREARLAGAQSTTNAPLGFLPVRIGVSTADPRTSRLVRRSSGDDAGYAASFSSAGISNPPANLASSIPSSQAPRQGRAISEMRWRAPQLIDAAETFPSPDWIYVTRNGPRDVGALPLTGLTDTENPTNADAVVGRFAYMVYDLSGIFDVRIAGFQSANVVAFRQKGGTPSSDLSTYLSDAGATAAEDLLAWRTPNAADETDTVYGVDPVSGNLGNPGFLERGKPVLNGKRNTMFSRKDLLQFAATFPDRLPSNLLPKLRSFSAAMVAPEISETVPGSPAYIQATSDLEIPAYSREGQLESYSVKAGEPVFQRKFPLSRLRWFAERNTDGSPANGVRAAIKQHFGLSWFDNLADAGITTPEYQGVPGWAYTSPEGTAAAGSIKTLAQVASLQREPDFFEWLKAVIPDGSLGKSLGSNNSSVNDTQDKAKDFQIIQIGANIMDQADYDDVPTLIATATARQRDGSPLAAFGVENLPYLNELVVSFRYDDSDRALLKAWYQFELWNPHRNATRSKTTSGGTAINKVRARVVEGETLLEPYLRVQRTGSTSLVGQLTALAALKRTSIPRHFSGNATNDACEIDVTSDAYDEPKVAGDSASVTAGVYENESGRKFRGGPKPGESGFKGILAGSAHAPNPIWPRDTRLPAAGIPVTETNIIDAAAPYFGTMTKPCGVKYWNAAQLANVPLTNNSPAGANPAPVTLVMEVEVDGKWIPYQTFESINNAPGVLEYPGRDPNHWGAGGSSNKLSFEQYFNSAWERPLPADADPYPGATASGNAESRMFYGWNGFCNRSGLIKMDPRTRRFFAGASAAASPGASIRETAAALDTSKGTDNRRANWDMMPISGTATPVAGYSINTAGAPARYADPDGTIRPADFADLGDGDIATIPGSTAARPVVLNRPFRSVAELGLVFRDMPWKSLDFFSAESADLNLFDVFAVEDVPVSQGKVNPNTADVATLTAIFKNAARNPGDSSAGTLGDAEALAAAQAIYQYINPATNTYFENLSHVAEHLPAQPTAQAEKNKIHREAFQRAVSGSFDTRTWNLMIDVIGQSGRLVRQADGLEDFVVMAESRFWLFVAIDRYTGKVVARRREAVYE